MVLTSTSKTETNVSRIKISMYIYAFLIIYTPNFFNNAYVNYALPFLYWLIGFFLVKGDKNAVVYKKNMHSILTFGVLSTVLFAFRALIAGVSFGDIRNLRIIQSISMIVSVFSFYYIERILDSKGFKSQDKMRFILNVCMIQFVIVLIMVAFPDFRMKMLEIFYLDGRKDLSFTISRRVYGIMSNYTFAGSVFHGMMAFFALHFGIHNDSRFFLYIPCMLLIVFLNGRIGLIVFLISTLTYLFSNLLFRRNVEKTVKVTVLLTVFAVLSLAILPIIWPSTFSFFRNGFLDVINYMKTGVAATDRISDVDLLSSQFKSDFNIKTLLLGAGHRIQNGGDVPKGISFNGLYSDIGFLNDMYMGGLVYMFLLYTPYVRFINFKHKNIEILSVIMLVILFVSNMKGEVFRSSIILGMFVYVKSLLGNTIGDDNDGKGFSSNGDIQYE